MPNPIDVPDPGDRCTFCNDPASVVDRDHGPMCDDCMDHLVDIEDFLEAHTY